MIFYFTQVSIFHHTLGTKVDITCHYLSAQHGISFPSILIQNATSIRLSLQHYRNVSNRLLNSNSQAQYISSIQVSKMCVVLGSQFLPFLFSTRSRGRYHWNIGASSRTITPISILQAIHPVSDAQNETLWTHE